MEYSEFSEQFFVVLSAIQDSLEGFPPTKELSIPADWSETQAILQRLADELMICVDVGRVVEKLREDQATLLIVVWLATKVEDTAFLSVLQRAYASAPEASKSLPGQPFASYLLELSKSPEPVWRKD